MDLTLLLMFVLVILIAAVILGVSWLMVRSEAKGSPSRATPPPVAPTVDDKTILIRRPEQSE